MDGSGLQGPMKAFGVVEVSVLRVTCRKLMNGPESIYPNYLYVLYDCMLLNSGDWVSVMSTVHGTQNVFV